MLPYELPVTSHEIACGAHARMIARYADCFRPRRDLRSSRHETRKQVAVFRGAHALIETAEREEDISTYGQICSPKPRV
jgi:hypothetical protein